MELGDDRGEIGFDLDPAGTAMGQVRVVEQLQAVGSAATELEQHQGELAAGIGRAGVVPVDHRKPAVRGAADVVGPEVAVTDLDRRHRLHHRLHVDQIGTDRGQLIGERRLLAPGLRHDLRPRRRPDRLGVPLVRAYPAGQHRPMQGGHGAADQYRVELWVRGLQVNPGEDPDDGVIHLGEPVAVAGPTPRGRGNPLRLGSGLKLGRHLSLRPGQRDEGRLHRPAATGGDQPPDLALLAAGDRAGEVDHRAEVVRRGDR